MDEAQQHSTDPASVGATDGEGGAGKKTLGLERWVQLSFLVLALGLVWLLQNVISAVWYRFADPSDAVVTAVAVVTGPLISVLLYKHAWVNQLSFEVADELSKVTWPTRRETSSSTVVVIITSIIAAGVLGFFDAVWSALTDLVYKV